MRKAKEGEKKGKGLSEEIPQAEGKKLSTIQFDEKEDALELGISGEILLSAGGSSGISEC